MEVKTNNGRNNFDQIHPSTQRFFTQGVPCNNKVYSESEMTARVTHDLKHLRDHKKVYYERVTDDQIDEFWLARLEDENRAQKRINTRFPELNAAREAYLGKEPEHS